MMGRQNRMVARQGIAIVIVIGCLAAFSMVALAMLRGALLTRHVFRSEHHLRQAELLLDAAATRTAARLAADPSAAPDSLDENLVIPADEITGSHDARIMIDVSPGDGEENPSASCSSRWRVRIVVYYPIDGPHAVRRTREVLLPAPNPKRQAARHHFQETAS